MKSIGANLLTNAACGALYGAVAIALSTTGVLGPEADMLIAGLFVWSFPMIIVALRIGGGVLSPAHYYSIFWGGQICLCFALGGLVRILTGSPLTTQGWIVGGLLLPPTFAALAIMQRALFSAEELNVLPRSKSEAGSAASGSHRRDLESMSRVDGTP